MSRLLAQRAERRRSGETRIDPAALPGPGPAGLRIAVGYPNRYALGMSNVGFQAVHRFWSCLPDVMSERFFLPDPAELDEYRRTGLPLRTLDSGSAVRSFDAVAFSITFEPDAVHLVRMLQLAGIPPLARDRGDRDPLVVAGGPITFLNPEPLAEFVDVFAIGEAEALLPALTEHLKRGSRRDQLAELAREPGFYVPATHRVEYDDCGRVRRRTTADAPRIVRAKMGKDARFPPPATFILTRDTEMSGKFLVEISRGCPTLCRFCWAGYNYLPKRSFELERLLALARSARPHTDRIGLVSTAVGAHREIGPLVATLKEYGFRISVSSVRFEDVRDDFVRPLAESGERTLAIAPEVGTDRLRIAIHKRVRNAEILDRVGILLDAGAQNLKLYLMVGLPGETDADVHAIPTLVRRIRDRVTEARPDGRVIASVNPFIPKPGTPFQWQPMAPLGVLNAHLRLLQRELARIPGVEAHCKSARMERLQALLSVGDRRLAPVLLALAEGRRLREAMAGAGLDPDFYLRRERGRDEVLPWSFLDNGMKDRLLQDQADRAAQLVA